MRYDANFKPVGEIALPSKYGEEGLKFFEKFYAVSESKDLLLQANYVDNHDYSAEVLVPITMQEPILIIFLLTSRMKALSC